MTKVVNYHTTLVDKFTDIDEDADFFEVPLLECDCILLCSDGLTNMVDDAEISRVLKTTDTLKEKTEALVDEANRNGGKDNIAIVLVEPQISEVKL